jgi:hypothetical protein
MMEKVGGTGRVILMGTAGNGKAVGGVDLLMISNEFEPLPS